MPMETKKSSYITIAALPLVIIYLEIMSKLFCFGSLSYEGVLFTVLLSLSTGTLLTLICSLLPKRYLFPAIIIMVSILCLFFALQNVYHNIFGAFLSFYSASEAGAVLSNFWREAVEGIRRSALSLIASFLPLPVLILLRKRIAPFDGNRIRTALAVCSITLHVAAIACIYSANNGVMSPRYLYSGTFMPELSVRYFGVLTAERQDINQLLLPAIGLIPESGQNPTPKPYSDSKPSPSVYTTVYAPNVLEIDFDSLINSESNPEIKKMHEYFASEKPSMQNEYTGLFKDKNLIWIVAEGFSDLALNETHTPTLYKLARSGFVFNNFYNPIWGVSTSDGEYITLTGLIPKTGVWSFTESAHNNMSMTLGKMLANEGYDCRAYHNHTYNYYNRDKSHPNMGYIYKGVGNGLDMEKVWPASDLEMVRETAGEYIGSDKFHAYYMTVSGHMYYTFTGNTQAYRHMDDVSDLPYSDNCRAYIACNMEFDLAVEELINRLRDADKLKDTVIVISGDHYPYGLTNSEIEEMRGGQVDSFELYRSSLIIWSGDMEKPAEVNKLCYSADIMPTLANLFGLKYDSRLLAGRDIFSDEQGFVIFSNHSFISEYGRYDSSSDRFYPADGVDVPENYARDTLYGRVSNAFKYSAAILDLDYYSCIMPQQTR